MSILGNSAYAYNKLRPPLYFATIPPVIILVAALAAGKRAAGTTNLFRRPA